jgi:hypothetical protein
MRHAVANPCVRAIAPGLSPHCLQVPTATDKFVRPPDVSVSGWAAQLRDRLVLWRQGAWGEDKVPLLSGNNLRLALKLPRQ